MLPLPVSTSMNHKLIEVDLGSVQPKSMTTTIQAPTTTLVLTCISRGPWSGCSGLSPQPQPLSPSVVCLGKSHHQQPWGLHSQPEKQKIPQARGDRFSPSLPQWQPSCRCLCRWPHQLTPPASMLCACCSSPLC